MSGRDRETLDVGVGRPWRILQTDRLALYYVCMYLFRSAYWYKQTRFFLDFLGMSVDCLYSILFSLFYYILVVVN